jgi:hypothetical protein
LFRKFAPLKIVNDEARRREIRAFADEYGDIIAQPQEGGLSLTTEVKVIRKHATTETWYGAIRHIRRAVDLWDRFNDSEGHEARSLHEELRLEIKRALTDTETPSYFSAMEIPRVRGRGFTDEDGPHLPQVVIVNNALAKKYFGKSDAVGQHVRMSPSGPSATIVGVVGDVRNADPETAVLPQLYTCLWQTDTISAPSNGVYLALRSVLPKNLSRN